MSKIIRTSKPSVLPWYAAALVFAVLCAVLPAYKLWALLLALGGAAVMCFLPAAIIAFVICGVMKKKMKTAQKASGAAAYVSGSVDLKDEVLKKEADGDPTVAGNKATLNWKSTINVDNLNGYVYYDYSDTVYLNSQHVNLQSIDLNDIQVLDKDQVDVTNQVTISTYSEITSGAECGLFKIDFGSADIHGPVTIKYKTTVDTSRLGEYANITNK